MMNYDKWRKDIEVSDDEDDTHPNVDTPSLFRWRHESRIIREKEMEEERKEIQRRKEILKESKKVVEKMKEQNGANPVVAKIEEECTKEARKLAEQEAEFAKKERLCPWNVDTMAKEGISKTVINAKPKSDQTNGKSLTEEEKAERLSRFVEENSKLLKKFGMLRRPLDSKAFLTENPHLVCEETASYLTLWCLELAMEEKFDLMEHISQQCVSLQFLLELALQVDRDPRECVPSFFAQVGRSEESEYKEAFRDRLVEFRNKIRGRAEEKIRKLVEKEKAKRLGPGGLDPYEVLESLPPALRECFEARDIPMLQRAFTEMPLEEAEYHLKRCIDSGLWCPGPQVKKDDQQEKQRRKPNSSDKEEIGPENRGDKGTPGKHATTPSEASFPFSLWIVLVLSVIVLLISMSVLYFTP